MIFFDFSGKQGRQLTQVSGLFLVFLCGLLMPVLAAQAAVQGQSIVNTASLSTAESPIPVVSAVTVAYVQRTPAQISFFQWVNQTVAVSTSAPVAPVGCQDAGGAWSQINTYQTLDKALHSLPSTPNLVIADHFKLGEPLFVRVADGDQNVDLNALDTIIITIKGSINHDKETLRLTETGVNTGVFMGMLQTSEVAHSHHDCLLTVGRDETITGLYTDQMDQVTTVTTAALIDPLGVVFNSSTGAFVDGVEVTLWDVVNDRPAEVFGDDGVSAYPATLITGSVATDSSGVVYTFSPGGYRFPLITSGRTYQLRVTAPLNFNFPSIIDNAALQGLPNAPFALDSDSVVGSIGSSRGGTFLVSGAVINIDIPLDPHPVALFMEKTASKKNAAIGDFLTYTLSLTNPNPGVDTTSLIIHDRLPMGLRYQTGSARLGGVPIAAVIAKEGRNLSFSPTVAIPKEGKITLSYVAAVGAKTPLGDAINRAWAEGVQLPDAVKSNVATATVAVKNELFSEKNILMGRIFVDGTLNAEGQLIRDKAGHAGNGMDDKGEEGLAAVRVYLEDGRYVQTDRYGFYHFVGVEPGSHVVQLDVDSLPEDMVAVALHNNRFSGRGFSQFIDLAPGSLWRTNFRVYKQEPPAVPVEITQLVIPHKDNPQYLNVLLTIEKHKLAEIEQLEADYEPPLGWTLLEASSFLNGKALSPEVTRKAGKIISERWIWPLPITEKVSKVRFIMQRGGTQGEKKGLALARFVVDGEQQGSTAKADAVLLDVRNEVITPKEFTLQTHFDVLGTILKTDDIQQLDHLIEGLQVLNIEHLDIIGHTDSQKIKKKWHYLYASNQPLSEARAQSVADYLRERLNLLDEQVSIQGRGEREPVADNKTEAGRSLNRRSVIRVYGSKTTITQKTEVLKPEGFAEGKIQPEWKDSREKRDLEAEKQARVVGILSPKEGQRLPYQSTAIRIQLDSRLKPRLFFDGKEIPRDRIGFTMRNETAKTTLYSYIGVDLGKVGEHQLRIEGVGPFGSARFNEEITVIHTGKIVRIIKRAEGDNIADGKTRVRFQIELQDENGETIHSGTELEIRRGELRPPVKHDVARLREVNKDAIVQVSADGWVEFEPVAQSGQYSVTLAYGDAEVDLNTFVKPEYRDMIMVGLAEGTLGYQKVQGRMEPLPHKAEREGWYQEGRLVFYAKGQIQGKWLLSAAYDTAKTKGSVRNSLFQTLQPNAFYTVYGDNTTQQFDAPSARKLYLKLERNTFYVLFGDYSTGLSVTELSRYTRTLNGLKSEWFEDKWGYKAFVSQTGQSLVHDEIPGDGTSGLYHLSRQDLTQNSEKIVIETRDRFRSELILRRQFLMRFVDYDIDYQKGTLFFKQPVMSRDSRFNPSVIVVDYETRQLSNADLTILGGRAFVQPVKDVEVGATLVQQEQVIGNDRLLGVDVKYKVDRNVRLKAEVAKTDTAVSGRASAWKLEVERQSKLFNARVYMRDVANGFGLGQVRKSENGTQKYGVDVSAQIKQPLRVDGQIYRQKTQSTGAVRDVYEVNGDYRIDKGTLRVGLRRAQDSLAAVTNTSNSMLAGIRYKITPKVSIKLNHDQALGNQNSVDFPTRTALGLDYLYSPKATIFAEQEWSRGLALESSISRLGVRGTPWTGAQLSSSVESRLSENGERAFANVGLKQTWKVNEFWSVDGGLDRMQTLKNVNSSALQLNPAVPLSSGSEDFTALSAGVSYRPDKWEWSGRMERRISSQDRRWGLFSGVLGDVNKRLSVSGRLQGFMDRSAAGAVADSASISLGAAWRPHYDRWLAMERFDIKYDRVVTGAVGSIATKNIRFINNLNANWQVNSHTQIAWQYGAKYVRDTIATQVFHSFLDLIGSEFEYNFKQNWDIHVNARRLYAYRLKQSQYHVGLSLGRSFVNNMWGSIGYNLLGFYDQDFSAGDFTAQGPFIKLRMKFDQNTPREWLRGH